MRPRRACSIRIRVVARRGIALRALPQSNCDPVAPTYHELSLRVMPLASAQATGAARSIRTGRRWYTSSTRARPSSASRSPRRGYPAVPPESRRAPPSRPPSRRARPPPSRCRRRRLRLPSSCRHPPHRRPWRRHRRPRRRPRRRAQQRRGAGRARAARGRGRVAQATRRWRCGRRPTAHT